jgi:hypothetical protein
MSVLDKFRKGAAKAGIQATAFIKEGSSRVQSSSQSFAQGFSLPGEAEKAAKILATFLGLSPTRMHPETQHSIFSKADPDHPESALNAIPKPVLQRARGIPTSAPSDLRLTPITRSLHPRPRRIPGHQSRLCFLRESRLRPCHFTFTRWFMVCPILHRNRWCRLGSANRRGHHRFCNRPQQRRCSSCVLPRRKRNHWRQHQCYCRSYRNWRERSSESRTSCADVLVLQV